MGFLCASGEDFSQQGTYHIHRVFFYHNRWERHRARITGCHLQTLVNTMAFFPAVLLNSLRFQWRFHKVSCTWSSHRQITVLLFVFWFLCILSYFSVLDFYFSTKKQEKEVSICRQDAASCCLVSVLYYDKEAHFCSGCWDCLLTGKC